MERCQVLIADDNIRARIGLKALLDVQQEIEVVGEAADGRQVVQMVRERQPDVVLMDVRMPQMDGLEATQQIKASWPGVRIVIMSMVTAHRTQALVAGADRFLSKGCPAEELLGALLGRQSGGSRIP